MKKKVLLPFLWLAACCMLLVTIVPHHHHIDGRICLQLSEIPENGQNRDITHWERGRFYDVVYEFADLPDAGIDAGMFAVVVQQAGVSLLDLAPCFLLLLE